MTKLAIMMSTYNKNDCLPNVLYSIKQQKIPYPYELVILDDVSDIDPEPIVKEFFPDANYIRFKERQGTFKLYGRYLEFVPKDTDVVVLQSADVIHALDYVLEDIVDNVDEKVVTTAQVFNGFVPYDAYKKDFGVHINNAINRWKIEQPIKRSGYGTGWYFFLGAIRKDDMFSLSHVYGKSLCDVILSDEMIKQGFERRVINNAIGIHCVHKSEWVPCDSMYECKVGCRVQSYFLKEKN